MFWKNKAGMEMDKEEIQEKYLRSIADRSALLRKVVFLERKCRYFHSLIKLYNDVYNISKLDQISSAPALRSALRKLLRKHDERIESINKGEYSDEDSYTDRSSNHTLQ